MRNETRLAKELLNAIWNEQVDRAEELLAFGADPSWIFNGFPILHHAVFTRNKKMVKLLLEKGASQIDSALAFALEQGIGSMVGILSHAGGVPRKGKDVKDIFGELPSRYAPLNYSRWLQHHS